MAVHRFNLRRLLSNIHCSTIYLQNNLKQSASSNNSTPVDLEDALDSFTTELMQKKKKLWDIRKEKLDFMKKHITNEHEYEVQSLSKEQIIEAINSALNDCNDVAVIELLRKSLIFNVRLSKDTIIQGLIICAQKGEIDLISKLEELCKYMDHLMPTHFSFEMYKAHAIWMKGNVIKGLEIFQDLYKKNPFLRRNIKMELKQLVTMGIKNNSEGVLIHFLKVADQFIQFHNDYFFLMCIWEYCFTSEWYSDQQLALNVLNENKILADLLTDRLPYLLICALKSHRTEIVYDLLERFYIMKMEKPCTIVVMALLDYHFQSANVGNYSEVIKWCKQTKIAVPSIYNEKYLDLLLKIDCQKINAKIKPKVSKDRKEFVF